MSASSSFPCHAHYILFNRSYQVSLCGAIPLHCFSDGPIDEGINALGATLGVGLDCLFLSFGNPYLNFVVSLCVISILNRAGCFCFRHVASLLLTHSITNYIMGTVCILHKTYWVHLEILTIYILGTVWYYNIRKRNHTKRGKRRWTGNSKNTT